MTNDTSLENYDSLLLESEINLQRNWVFATNADFLITISLEPWMLQTLDISNYEFR